MIKITLIVAVDKNNLIGKNNKLPWPKIKEDLNHFKNTTLGKAVIMGRKTYESIGKALPGRRNYVLSSQKINDPLVTTLKSVNDIYNLEENELFVIGGSQIYQLFLPIANKIIISRIPFEFEGDTFFPEINFQDWQLVNSEKIILGDFDNLPMTVETFVRSN